jgi:hypothetical protein
VDRQSPAGRGASAAQADRWGRGVVHRHEPPIIATLRRAEDDPSAKAEALRMFGILPAFTKRRILSVFGGVMWARERAAQSSRGRCSIRLREPDEPCARFSDLPSNTEKFACEERRGRHFGRLRAEHS